MTAAFVGDQAGLDAPALWGSVHGPCLVARAFTADPSGSTTALLATLAVPDPPAL